MIYRQFALKDSSVYSNAPNDNTGLDEILDIGVSDIENSVTRSLICFDKDKIDTIKTLVDGNYDEFLNIHYTNGHNVPSEYTIQLKQLVDGDWENGIGFQNTPSTEGITWNKYVSDYLSTETLVGEQTFSIYTDRDLTFDVKDSPTYSFSLNLKNDNTLKLSSRTLLHFYSKDTHTIFEPVYELRYDDSVYDTTQSTATLTTEPYVSLTNNSDKLYANNMYRINVSCRERHPTRSFIKNSIFNKRRTLPITSWYAIRDLSSGHYLIDFDENYTKISLDTNGNFFMFDTSSLATNRYYTFDIKTRINNVDYIFKDNIYFKLLD
jgi:hypothetical protein